MLSIKVKNTNEGTIKPLGLQVPESGIAMAGASRALKAPASPPERLGDFVTWLFSAGYEEGDLLILEREVHSPTSFL